MGFCSNGWISSNNKLRYYLILFNGDFQKYDKSSATDEECNLMTLNEPSYVARIRKEHLEKYPNLDSWNTLLSYLIYVSETICKISMYLLGKGSFEKKIENFLNRGEGQDKLSSFFLFVLHVLVQHVQLCKEKKFS